MPHMGVIKEVEVPAKGFLTRVDVIVSSAVGGGESATVARVIILDESFPNTEAGFAAAKIAYWNHLWDSNIDETLDIDITDAGTKVSRIFENGGLDYENQDSPQVGKLYVFVDIDNTTAQLAMVIQVRAQTLRE
jgi:hypothetical protein